MGGTQAAALAPITVALGDSVLVDVSFKYTAPSAVDVDLTASLWLPPGVDYTVKRIVSLEAGTNQTWTGVIEIPITEESGLRNYTYILGVALPAYGIGDQVSDAVTCTGMPEGGLATNR
ncbi:unnamed protein product [marine sediment metagenome]|uniref:Uncharacterized protein n=1 Tax=marine sediment metagenome TaxID=412755 RepID=X1J6N7_9ZZZZ